MIALVLSVSLVPAAAAAQAADRGTVARHAFEAEAPIPSPDAFAALIGAAREQAATAVGDPDSYVIEARFDPGRGTVNGDMRITFVNRTDEALADVVLSLLPNSNDYAGVAIAVDTLRVGGHRIDQPNRGLSEDETSLLVPVSRPLPPGGSIEIAVGFTTTLAPDDDAGNYLELDEPPGTWFLEWWYPILAPYEPSRGWLLAPPVIQTGRAPWGVALYDVTLTMPNDLHAVTTGDLIEERLVGADARRRYVAGPTEAFHAIADEDFTSVSAEVGDSIVRVHADSSEAETARRALTFAEQALAAYSDRFGAYPFRELDIVQTPLKMGMGYSSEGLIVVGSPLSEGYDEDEWDYEPPPFETDPDEVDLVTHEALLAHEVAHQWWGNSVRSDYVAHAFMVEGLTEYVAFTQLEASLGEKVARRVMVDDAVQPYIELLDYEGDEIADRTGRRDLWYATHYGIVYGKGALGFLAINVEIGDAAFDAALRAYAADHAFGVTTPEDLREAFESASGEDLDELWRTWFETAETTPDDVRDLLRAAA